MWKLVLDAGLEPAMELKSSPAYEAGASYQLC